MYCKLSVSILIDESRLNELAHEARCYLAILVLLLKLKHLLLELLHLSFVDLCFSFLLCINFLLLPNLGLGATAFAAHLEHVGRDSLRCYSKKKRVRVERVM